MHILQLEQERTLLKEKLVGGFSNQAKLLFIYNFFEKLLSTENKNLIDSYLPEFFPDYIRYLKSWKVFGLEPRTCLAGRQVHELIIEQAEITEMRELTKEYQKFPELISSLKEDVEKLKKILNGEQIETVESKAFFPLLDEAGIKETGITIGILESVTIKISKSKSVDKFIIVPSEKEIEEKIDDQVKLSWLNAVRISKKYVRKIHPYHKIIISFDKRAGFCKGNSLGTALTLAFIEEILKIYNSPVAVKVGEGIALTGGMNEQGKITSTSEEIIKQKTELVFFSDVTHFAVPKVEEAATIEKLNELKQEYPKRDLKITGVEDLNDLLNRRNLVEIKKINPAVRSAKFVKKNWGSAAVAALLTVILSFVIVLDFDSNPYSFTADTDKIYIKNKSGKVLWSKSRAISKELIDSPNYLKTIVKIVDIDSDRNNEVLIAGIKDETKVDGEYFPLMCYSSDGNLIWYYSFKDTVHSKSEKLPPVYATMIIDTITFNEIQSVFAYATNSLSFSSAIFRLNLKTGKRLPGTFWCSGHIVNGIIKDVNGDGKHDIVCIGVDNGYEDAVFFAKEIDTLITVRPSTEEYIIRNFPVSEMHSYIRFPKTDYDILKKYRTPAIAEYSFEDIRSDDCYQFIVYSYLDEVGSTLWYRVNYNFLEVNVIVDNRFRVVRDSLVANNELSQPFTDTDEYINLVRRKILYWNYNNWCQLPN